MPTEAAVFDAGRDIATVRILRMATAIALALVFSQAINWPASFLTPVLISVILCLPLPAPSLKLASAFTLTLVGALFAGLLLLPALHHQPIAGLMLLLLALFGCFYFGASGGSPILSLFLLLGVTVIPAIGSESIDLAIGITGGIAICAVIAFAFVWTGFALFPDPAAEARSEKPEGDRQNPTQTAAVRSAVRSTLIVAPALLWMIATPQTIGYVAALIKIATMGQQVSLEKTRKAGNELMLSTFIGGIAAIIVFGVLQVWPSLLLYGLMFLLAGLIMGPRIFAGRGLTPNGSMWSYALLTMMIIVAPAALDVSGDSAGSRFADRLVMFTFATAYAVAAVYLFDGLWPARVRNR